MKSIYTAVALLAIATAPALADSTNTNTNTAVAQSNTHVTDNRGTHYPVNTAIAPSFATGNACAVGGGLGMAGANFGLSIGGTKESANCASIQAAQMAMALAQAGMIVPGAVVGTACQNDHFRAGMAAAGTPCAQDRAQPQPRSRRASRSQPTGGFDHGRGGTR